MITQPGTVEVIAEHLPPLGPTEVYVRTLLSGISHGTELAWLRGQAAALHRTWDPEQRIYLNGAGRDFPVAPGYETVARIAQLGDRVTGLNVGDLVCLDRPHADGHILDAATATAGLLPEDVNPEWAVFFVLARVALGAVHDAALSIGDTVVIVGLGTVGLLAAQQAQSAGANVIGVDRYPRRLTAAEHLGIHTIHADEADTDVAAEVRRRTGPAGADAAIEASGSYTGLHEAIRCLRVGGRVVTVASYHGDQPGLRLGEEYHRNRITLISSMTVNGCPQRNHPDWSLDRLNATARELITSGRIRTDTLITHRVPFERAAYAYTLITDTPHDTIKVVLTYDN
ncbi:zinc-binding dehydrogenase [Micromonospora sp. CPCC 205371]|nr:zinc-binding dehydrogenase [Micromonospora sp. CPCC 205371]